MDERKIVVVVEEVEVARTALQWALHNLLRYGDTITLLHVFSSSSSSRSKSKKKNRLLRLKGFQLALSFQDICNTFSNVSKASQINYIYMYSYFMSIFMMIDANSRRVLVIMQTKVEIVVSEGDQEGRKISAIVREIGASVLVVGLHDHSFLYK